MSVDHVTLAVNRVLQRGEELQVFRDQEGLLTRDQHRRCLEIHRQDREDLRIIHEEATWSGSSLE